MVFGGACFFVGLEHVGEAFDGSFFGLWADFFCFFCFDEAHCCLYEVPHHAVDVSSDVADFGEFGGFDFDEGCCCEFGEASCYFGFSDACGADHEYVFGDDFVAHLFGEELSSPSVSECDGDGAFGVCLSDDVFVEFLYDLLWCEVEHGLGVIL